MRLFRFTFVWFSVVRDDKMSQEADKIQRVGKNMIGSSTIKANAAAN
jgi:hypothetical protein